MLRIHEVLRLIPESLSDSAYRPVPFIQDKPGGRERWWIGQRGANPSGDSDCSQNGGKNLGEARSFSPANPSPSPKRKCPSFTEGRMSKRLKALERPSSQVCSGT